MSAKLCAALALACALDGAARADDLVDRIVDYDAHLASGVGIAVALGGGVLGFTDRAVRGSTSPAGGSWDLRAVFGTHFPIAFEAAYLGSANHIQSAFGRDSETLIGTALETDVRFNALPHRAIDPYAFVGMGWERFDIDDRDFPLADTGIRQHDNMLEVPIGAGISYRRAGLVADLRGTLRETVDAPMHAWNTSLSVGYYF